MDTGPTEDAVTSRILPCIALALLLAACTRPQPPDPERPPEPQAGADTASG